MSPRDLLCLPASRRDKGGSVACYGYLSDSACWGLGATLGLASGRMSLLPVERNQVGVSMKQVYALRRGLPGGALTVRWRLFPSECLKTVSK